MNMLLLWMEVIIDLKKGETKKKHSQMHNRPKALSTLTHSTPLVQSISFNEL